MSSTTEPSTTEPSTTEPSTTDDPAANEARADAAAQIRRLHHGLVGHEHEPAVLAEITELLSRAATRLESGRPRAREPWTGREEKDIPADGTEFALDFHRPVSGPGNPWSIPTPIHRVDHKAITTVTLGSGYEGAPGRSHGGIIAAIYDDLCGYNLVLEATLAFTGWIRIDYRAGTPLHEPITFRTWVGERNGRKLQILGDCQTADGTLLSTCDSIFIIVEPDGQPS